MIRQYFRILEQRWLIKINLQYKEFLNEINKVLKKFISLEGKEYKNVNSLNKNISPGDRESNMIIYGNTIFERIL